MNLLNAVASLLLIVAASAMLVSKNGSKGRKVQYGAQVSVNNATGADSFSIELEPILFPILSLQNKFRVIRINIRNQSSAPLRLSATNDSIQVKVGNQLVRGRFSISDSDPAWWNGLSFGMREALAYPDQAPIRSGEEDNVFVFFPVTAVPDPPEEVLFTVASVSAAPIHTRRRSIASAR